MKVLRSIDRIYRTIKKWYMDTWDYLVVHWGATIINMVLILVGVWLITR